MADYSAEYRALQQNRMFDELKKMKEQQQRAAQAQYVMKLSNMNPQTMGGYIAGQLLGDSINRWLNRKGNDNPYGNGTPATNEDIMRMRNQGVTFGDGNETSPETGWDTANATNDVNLLQVIKKFPSYKDGASGLLGIGFSTNGTEPVNVDDAMKKIKEEFNLLNWGGNN